MKDAMNGARAGFSSVEAVLVMAVLAMATLSMSHTMLGSRQSMQHLREDSLIRDQAHTLLSRLQSIPFGSNAGPVSALQVASLVSLENDFMGSPIGQPDPSNIQQIYSGVSVSLRDLEGVSPITWEYAINGDDYFVRGGTWSIIIDRDLNGDGDLLDPFEGQDDLLRIELRHDGRSILRSIRSRNPNE